MTIRRQRPDSLHTGIDQRPISGPSVEKIDNGKSHVVKRMERLVMPGEPTVDKAFDEAITHVQKTVKRVFDATADVADEMKEATKS